MRVIASPPAVARIREQGGRLYVWPKTVRCCHPYSTLVTGAEGKPGHEFDRVPAEGFELYVARMRRHPDELHVDLRRRRVEAYWDGCAWVI